MRGVHSSAVERRRDGDGGSVERDARLSLSLDPKNRSLYRRIVKAFLSDLRFRLTGWWSALKPAARGMLAGKILALALFILSTNQGLGLGRRSVAGYVVFSTVWIISLISFVHIAFFGGRIARLVWSILFVTA